MEIVLISCPNHINGETDLINNMFEFGLSTFHLRKPDYREEQLREFLKQIDPVFLSRIKLHSDFGLLEQYSLGGIHIPVSMSVKSNILRLKRDKRISISSSFHSFYEVKEKNKYIDYAFLSPVFDSISKKNYKSGFDHNELRMILQEVKIRIIALGGCKAENLGHIKWLGFSGAAVLGAVWHSADPLSSYLEIKKTAEVL